MNAKAEISTPIIMILIVILSWFVYGAWSGVLSMLLLYIVLGISLIISIIPFIGIILMYIISESWTIPTILSFTNTEYTWIVTAIKIFIYICGFIITAATSIGVILLRKR